MFFIAKTPLGEYKSAQYEDEDEISMIKKLFTDNLPQIDNIYFNCELEENGGLVTVCLPPETVKNSVFIIVE